MRLALLIYRYFPFGGQQRDMLAIAREAVKRGHDLTVICHQWQGDRPPGLKIVEVPVRGWANYRRMVDFARRARAELERMTVDLVIGFVKLPGLDVYFAADSCFAHKAFRQRGTLYRLLPRTRGYLALEREVFGADSRTHILEITDRERQLYRDYYGTDPGRFHTLRPGISRDRRAPADHARVRRETRQALAIPDNETVLLALGSGFRTKGLDRSIHTLKTLLDRGRQVRLLVAGQDRETPFRRLAESLGVATQVQFLGGRDDVPALLQAADVLIHPAYREAAGIILLEAIIAGLPVVATRTCGYSPFIEEAAMGVVVDDTAAPEQIANAVEKLLATDTDTWHHRGRAFADSADIYDSAGQVVDILESLEGRP